VGTWLAVFFVESRYLPGLLGAPPNLDIASIAGNPTYVASFLIYFVLGFLLYAAVLVMIGSVCNTLKEAQNMMQPITLLLIVPLLAMVPIARDPNGTLAVVLSYVPVFTPFVMMNRAAGPPTVLEYVVTTILLLAAIALSLWAAAKVFRIGVLMTGKPPRLTEVIKWIGAPVGATPPRRGSGG
jgi:ABC-type Na+ efflux pump permease subunit